MSRIETDVLILGAGIAGLVVALSARGRRVCILTPDNDTASDLAQGGIAAAVGVDDTPELHLNDTLFAGQHRNSLAAARLVCREAAKAVEYLESNGVSFARAQGQRSLHKEAAHSRARVLHVGGDSTGSAIMQALRRRIAESPHIESLVPARATRLSYGVDGVCGVHAQTEDGRVITVQARDVVIATGGTGGLYSRTTNPSRACGDGVAMALAAGARTDALEFVQFHPTALEVDARPLPLMTEALRGAGATLVDESGASIMRDVDELGDLAPRDVVARAVYARQSEGRRVWLDATRLEQDVSEAFPSAFRLCRAHGIDPRREPIPVTPAAHYHMGGIAVDLEGRASLPRLWAVGEAACTGMHGANRLASNSLLESVVFGRRVGRALGRKRSVACPVLSALHAEPLESFDDARERDLREVMWRCMGVVRNASRLAEGLTFVARMRERTSTTAVLQLSRLLLVEQMMLAAARRTTSCGAHSRSDAGPRLNHVASRRRTISLPRKSRSPDLDQRRRGTVYQY